MNERLDAEIDRCAALVLVSVMGTPEREAAISAFGQHAFAAGKLLPEAGDESMRWLLHRLPIAASTHSWSMPKQRRPTSVRWLCVKRHGSSTKWRPSSTWPTSAPVLTAWPGGCVG